MFLNFPGFEIEVDESGATLHLDLPKTQDSFEFISELYRNLYPWLPAQFKLQDLATIRCTRDVLWMHDPESALQ